MQSTRPQYFRFRYIDREVRRGRYPNCPQLGETLGVSTRTIPSARRRLREPLERIRERYEPPPPSTMRSRRKGQGTGRVLKPPSPARMPV
jgi:hypothetical protein